MLRRAPHRFALVASLLAACTGAEIPGFSRETAPDGRTIVSYAAGLPTHEDTLVALFEIGKYVEDTSTIFADLRDIAIDGDGRIFALDFQASHIRVFAADGTPDTIIGRRGEGPGEFGQANGLRFGPDGTLWVNDPSKRALLALDRDGRERARPRSIVPGYGYRWAVVTDTAGVMWEPWSRALSGGEPDMEATGLVEGRSLRMFHQYDPTNDTRDSVNLDEGSFRSYRASYGGGQVGMGLPFAPRALMALDAHRRVWATTGESYRLVRMNLSADTTLDLSVAESGAPVSEGDIATWKEGLTDFTERVPTLVNDLMAYMPTHKPPLTQIFADDQDRLWVGRTMPDGDASRWDVFNSEGEFLGVIRAPVVASTFLNPVVVRDRIYLVANGEAGERYIVVAELPRLGQALR